MSVATGIVAALLAVEVMIALRANRANVSPFERTLRKLAFVDRRN